MDTERWKFQNICGEQSCRGTKFNDWKKLELRQRKIESSRPAFTWNLSGRINKISIVVAWTGIPNQNGGSVALN